MSETQSVQEPSSEPYFRKLYEFEKIKEFVRQATDAGHLIIGEFPRDFPDLTQPIGDRKLPEFIDVHVGSKDKNKLFRASFGSNWSIESFKVEGYHETVYQGDLTADIVLTPKIRTTTRNNFYHCIDVNMVCFSKDSPVLITTVPWYDEAHRRSVNVLERIKEKKLIDLNNYSIQPGYTIELIKKGWRFYEPDADLPSLLSFGADSRRYTQEEILTLDEAEIASLSRNTKVYYIVPPIPEPIVVSSPDPTSFISTSFAEIAGVKYEVTHIYKPITSEASSSQPVISQ